MTRMRFSFLAIALLAGRILFAQSVQEARKLMYYERFQSAKTMLQQVVAANPADAEAVYWLSQAEFGLKNVPGARAVLVKGMEGANGSHPMLLAAMGQVELAEGQINAARQRFETALSLNKGPQVPVLNAIGKANLEKAGDGQYAIEKLKMAVQQMESQKKGVKDPDVYINLGDAYRKQMDGGASVSAYQNALQADPKYAAAKYKTGKVYLTQGNDQKDVFLKNFEDAIAMDPSYGPALYELYSWYFFRDVYKSTEYFNKYRQYADPGPALDYEEASLLFASADYKGAISKAEELIKKQGNQADARLYRMEAYCYDKLGDSLKAVEQMETFFRNARPDQIVPDNYVSLAVNSAKFPDRQHKVESYFQKAVEIDTSLANRVNYTRQAANFFKNAKNQPKTAEWMTKVLMISPNPGKVDIYNAGFENFRAGQYLRSDSIFKIYTAKYPEEVYGPYWSFRALSVIDSTMEQGLAIPDCERFITIAEKDKVKNKNTLITAYGYMAGFTANSKKDYTGAIAYMDKILELDPTNADAVKNREILVKAAARSPKTPAPKSPGTP